jgi:hypothetical protein
MLDVKSQTCIDTVDTHSSASNHSKVKIFSDEKASYNSGSY